MNNVTLISVNFNLRNVNAKGLTPLYVVIYFINENGEKKQLKIPTKIKVLPLLWDGKRQLPIIYSDIIAMSNEKMQQQAKILQYITNIKCTLMRGITYEIDFIKDIIYNKVKKNNLEKSANSFGGLIFNPYISDVNKNRTINNNIKVMKHKNSENESSSSEFATNMIDNAFFSFIKRKEQKETTQNLYKGHIRYWKKWVKETKQPNTIELFTRAKFYAFKQYMEQQQKTTKTINAKCQFISALIGEIAETEQGINFGIVPINFKETKTQKEKKDTLNNDEIAAFYDVKCNNNKEQYYKDVFLLQLATGQRVSDLYELIGGNYSTDVEYINLPTLKCTKGDNVKYAQIEVTKEVVELLNKIRKKQLVKLPKFKKELNFFIKEFARRQNLTRKVSGGKINEKITSHYARHTFITNKLIEGYNAYEVAQMVGNTEQEILRTYAHLTNNDKINNLKKKRDMLQQKKMETSIPKKENKNYMVAYLLPLVLISSLTLNFVELLF